jgi:asparagine synthetase B (glutamine-hydrolysing)
MQDVKQWDINNPTEFVYEDHYSRIREVRDFGGRLVLPIGGVAYKVCGGKRSFYLYHSAPGLIPLYFILRDDIIYFSMSMLAMRQKADEIGARVKDIQQAKEGIAYHLSQKGLKRYLVDPIKPATYQNISLDKAADALLKKLVDAAEPYKGQKVLTPISGGTDGTLTALALKAAGVEQLCVCVGRTEEDFDPKFARTYAEQLGLNYAFLTLPEDDAGLQALLERTLGLIEQTDFSNVLMGMCNVLLADYAKAHGCTHILNADLADVVLGNDIFTYGKFNKDTEKPSAAKWAQYRISEQLRTLPTNLMIFKAAAFAGLRVGQLFADREVIEFLLSLSLECTPPNGKKPLYYAVLNKHLNNGSWVESGKKVGFYTGAGIGKIRLENPILQDENIRKTFKKVQGN